MGGKHISFLNGVVSFLWPKLFLTFVTPQNQFFSFGNRLPYIMMSLRKDRNGTATGAASLSKTPYNSQTIIAQNKSRQTPNKLNQTMLDEQSYDTVWTY